MQRVFGCFPPVGLAVLALLWQSRCMADRIAPIRKNTSEILNDLVHGHRDAQLCGADKGKKYLLNFIERANSIPNAV